LDNNYANLYFHNSISLLEVQIMDILIRKNVAKISFCETIAWAPLGEAVSKNGIERYIVHRI